MAGIFDYLKWRGDIPLAAVPLGEADKLILSEVCYIDMTYDEPIPLPEFCERALHKLFVLRESGAKADVLHHKQDERLLNELKNTPRFESLLIGHIKTRRSKEHEEQFGAMTVIHPSGDVCVIYRGTDWSIIGWKEDFNMAFETELPAQRSAVEYLEDIATLYRGRISVFGHSKGGNLAVYAAVFCSSDVRDRISDITSFDGPGFSEDVVNSGRYKAIEERLTTFMPASSIVAALFSCSGKFTVVKSNAAGVLQHIPYNWEIMAGGFVTARRDVTTEHISEALNKWIGSLSVDERRRFVNTVWSVIDGAKMSEIGDLFNGKKAIAMIKGYSLLDEDSKHIITEAFGKLNMAARQNLLELFNKK